MLEARTPPVHQRRRKSRCDDLLYLEIDSVLQVHSKMTKEAFCNRKNKARLFDLNNRDELDRIIALSG